MDVLSVIKKRRSIRNYKPDKIPDEIMDKLLEAMRLAPSAGNRQPYKFIIVQDKDTKVKLSSACRWYPGRPHGQAFIAEAPVILVCCAETDNHVMTCGQLCYPIDVAIAIDHITLCATAEGLGTCWIGAFYEDQVKEILRIPPHIRVVELLPLGYPRDPSPVEKQRLPMERIVRYEQWD